MRSTYVVMRSVEDILLREAGVSVDILAEAKERLKDDQDLGDVLGEFGALTATQWAKALATSYDLPYSETLTPGAEQAELIDQIPLSFAKRYHLFPLGFWGEEVTVAIANPQEVAALDDLHGEFAQGHLEHQLLRGRLIRGGRCRWPHKAFPDIAHGPRTNHANGDDDVFDHTRVPP